MKTSNLIEIIRSEAQELSGMVREWREWMHQHPEPSFKEFQTMSFVSNKLSQYGIAHETGIGGTGVIGLINAPFSTTTIGLRADLDALPIAEKNEVHYKSLNEGWMHACGHDVHTAILLGAAIIIQKNREKLNHNVKLVFQPGEEMNPGGASILIENGVLENPKVNAMFALHVYPEMETGSVGIRSGLYMASSDEIQIEIHGKGGHGALPERCINPLFMGSELIISLKEHMDKICPINIPTVLNFGRFEALGSTNVVPEKAFIKGTFRTMDPIWREEAFDEMNKIAANIVSKYGGHININRSKGYPNLHNNPRLASILKTLYSEALGDGNVQELDMRMTAEDFAFYAEKVPSCFFRLGVGNLSKGIVHAVHHPNFDIDTNSLEIGVYLMALIPFFYEDK